MKEKKIPTREQLKEYRQLISNLDDCGKNLPELIDKIDAFSEEFDVFTKEYVEDGKCGVKDAVISKGLIFGPEFDGCDLSEYGVEYITLNFELKF